MFDIDNPFWIIALGQNSKEGGDDTCGAGPNDSVPVERRTILELRYTLDR
jgi:hypothetical protein